MDAITNSDHIQLQNMAIDNDIFKSENSEEETMKSDLSTECKLFEDFKLTKTRQIFCNEPGCSESFKFIKMFRDHLQEKHAYDMSSVMMSFSSMTEFIKWKDSYEVESCCSFVKKTGSRLSSAMKQTYLYCNRSGFYETKKSSNRKSMKSGTVCTASIIYKEMSHGEISVTFYPKHYGHEIDTNMRKALRMNDKSASEISEGRYSNAINNHTSLGVIISSPTRLSKINRKDSKKLNMHLTDLTGIPTSCLENEYPSLDAWCVELMRQSSPAAIYYKPLGYKSDALSPYDLCLVLMTNHMRNMMGLFGDNLIYVSTLSLPKVNYHATFLFILDEFCTPFPVLVMVSNKMNNVYTRVMFEVLHSNLKSHQITLKTKIFMTDKNPTIFKNWNEIMQTESQHMMCPRFIDGEWRRYLATITNEELQDEVYDQLCELLEPRDHEAKYLLDKVIEKLDGNPICLKFLNYFRKNYADCFDEWGGHSLRNVLNLRSLPNFEKTVSEIQETLDAKYKKYAKNIVKILQLLLKRMFLYLYTRATSTQAVLTSIENYHRESMSLDLRKVYRTENENEWQVVLENIETKAIVTKNSAVPKCSLLENWECSITCSQCEICIHEYSCTCHAYSVQSIICVHVHLVVRLMRHSLLSNVLQVNDASLCSKDNTDPVPQDMETETNLSTPPVPMTVPLDEVSIRKAIIQSLNCTQDNLYLIQDRDKLKALLAIAEELHSLSCEMHERDQTNQVKGKRFKTQKSRVMKQITKKNSNTDIMHEHGIEEAKENEKGVTQDKQFTVLANKHVKLKPGEIKVTRKNVVVVPPKSIAMNVNVDNAVGALTEIGPMKIAKENVILPSQQTEINVIGNNAILVPTEIGTVKTTRENVIVPSQQAEINVIRNNAVFVPTELCTFNTAKENVVIVPSQQTEMNVTRDNAVVVPTEIGTMKTARENVVIVPSQNIEIYLNENKNAEKKLHDAHRDLDTGAKIHQKNVVLVSNAKLELVPSPIIESVSKPEIVSVPESNLESASKLGLECNPNFGMVAVSKSSLDSGSNTKIEFASNSRIESSFKSNAECVSAPRLNSVSNSKIGPVPNLIKKVETKLNLTKTAETEQQGATKKSLVFVDTIDKLDELQIGYKINCSQTTPDQIQNSNVIVEPKKSHIKLQQEPKPKTMMKTNRLSASPSVKTSNATDNTSASTITSWEIEISWQNKKILIPLFNDPKIEIEKIIQKLNAGHFVYKNEKDKRCDIISSHKSSIIEQLTVILTTLQNPESVAPSKPPGLVAVKLLEHREPLTLKRKIEEYSHQVHTKKHNDMLIVNEANKGVPSNDSLPLKKVKPNDKDVKIRSVEKIAQKETCDPKKITQIAHIPNVKEIVQREVTPTTLHLSANKIVQKEATQIGTSEVEASPEKIPRKNTEVATIADLSHQDLEAPTIQQEPSDPTQQDSEAAFQKETEVPIQQGTEAAIEHELEAPNQQELEAPIQQGTEAAIPERTIPKRVVRTLRPQMQNKFNSPHNKGVLKVLKPCIRELTKGSEV